MTPTAAIGAGCFLVPGDRQNAGAVGTLSVLDNVSLPVLETVANGWSIRGSRLAANATVLAERFDVRPRDPALPIGALSGGNQQKAILGRALRCGPSLLVVDDPTAGVDIGSRAQVHAIVREAADAGCAVVLASTDFDEVAAHADRALVMWHGRVGGQLSGGELTSSALARASYGPRTAHRKGEA
jgi:ribose transport system ATP-binding protein